MSLLILSQSNGEEWVKDTVTYNNYKMGFDIQNNVWRLSLKN